MIKKLGIFDSGLGGYSVYHDLMKTGPDITYILYADQKNAPYGNKDAAAITKLAIEAMQWFQKQGIRHVLLACNTVSSISLESLQSKFPDMTIWGIIDLTLAQLEDENVSNLAVVSTVATHQSNAYQKKWGKTNFISRPLPALVSYIEENAPVAKIDGYLHDQLASLSDSTHLVLACTHYPLVYHLFAKNYPGEIVDSRAPIRDFVYKNASNSQKVGRIYTSGDPHNMEEQIFHLFGVREKVSGL